MGQALETSSTLTAFTERSNSKICFSDQIKPYIDMASALIWLTQFSAYLLQPRWVCWWSDDTKTVSQRSFEVLAVSLFELNW